MKSAVNDKASFIITDSVAGDGEISIFRKDSFPIMRSVSSHKYANTVRIVINSSRIADGIAGDGVVIHLAESDTILHIAVNGIVDETVAGTIGNPKADFGVGSSVVFKDIIVRKNNFKGIVGDIFSGIVAESIVVASKFAPTSVW